MLLNAVASIVDCSTCSRSNCIALRTSFSCRRIERCVASVTKLYSGEFSCVSGARLGVLPALRWCADDDGDDADDKISNSLLSMCGICFILSAVGSVDKLIGGGGGLTVGRSMLAPRLNTLVENGFCFGSGGSGLFGLNAVVEKTSETFTSVRDRSDLGCTTGILDESCFILVI